MMDENDRSHEDHRSLRHISRKESSEDTAPIEVDSSAFFSAFFFEEYRFKSDETPWKC